MDISFKAVLFDASGRVLLGTNPRNEDEARERPRGPQPH